MTRPAATPLPGPDAACPLVVAGHLGTLPTKGYCSIAYAFQSYEHQHSLYIVQYERVTLTCYQILPRSHRGPKEKGEKERTQVSIQRPSSRREMALEGHEEANALAPNGFRAQSRSIGAGTGVRRGMEVTARGVMWPRGKAARKSTACSNRAG